MKNKISKRYIKMEKKPPINITFEIAQQQAPNDHWYEVRPVCFWGDYRSCLDTALCLQRELSEFQDATKWRVGKTFDVHGVNIVESQKKKPRTNDSAEKCFARIQLIGMETDNGVYTKIGDSPWNPGARYVVVFGNDRYPLYDLEDLQVLADEIEDTHNVFEQ